MHAEPPTAPMRSSCRRPALSDMAPQTGVVKNWHSAYAIHSPVA